MLRDKIIKMGLVVVSFIFCLSATGFATAQDCPQPLGSTIPGSYTSLPLLYFIEEWDNGLTGNHDWIHGISDLDNGEGDNYVEESIDMLVKWNNRYAGYHDEYGRYNDSSYLFDDQYLLVTPETRLQFMIHEMSSNISSDIDPVIEWQSLIIKFLNSDAEPPERSVQLWLSTDPAIPDYCVGFPQTCFRLSIDEMVQYDQNIYELLQILGIQILGPLYITSIAFYQQIESTEYTGEVEQTMQVDYIRILPVEE